LYIVKRVLFADAKVSEDDIEQGLNVHVACNATECANGTTELFRPDFDLLHSRRI
jgi:hypothetical protein